jgi:hypothetical protein
MYRTGYLVELLALRKRRDSAGNFARRDGESGGHDRANRTNRLLQRFDPAKTAPDRPHHMASPRAQLFMDVFDQRELDIDAHFITNDLDRLDL